MTQEAPKDTLRVPEPSLEGWWFSLSCTPISQTGLWRSAERAGSQWVGPVSSAPPHVWGPRLLGNGSLSVSQPAASCSDAAPSQHSLPANRNHPAWRSPLPFAPAASRPSREQDTKKRVLSRWKAAQRGRGLQLRPRAATRRVASHPRVLGTCLVSAQKALFSQKSLRTEMIGPVLSVFLGAAQQRWRSPQVEGQEGLVSVPPWLPSTRVPSGSEHRVLGHLSRI